MVFCHKQKNMARLKRLVLVVDENAVNQVLKMLTAIAELSQRKIEVASEDEIEAMSEKEDAVNDNKSSESFKGNNAQVADDPEYKLLFPERTAHSHWASVGIEKGIPVILESLAMNF